MQLPARFAELITLALHLRNPVGKRLTISLCLPFSLFISTSSRKVAFPPLPFIPPSCLEKFTRDIKPSCDTGASGARNFTGAFPFAIFHNLVSDAHPSLHLWSTIFSAIKTALAGSHARISRTTGEPARYQLIRFQLFTRDR